MLTIFLSVFQFLLSFLSEVRNYYATTGCTGYLFGFLEYELYLITKQIMYALFFMLVNLKK